MGITRRDALEFNEEQFIQSLIEMNIEELKDELDKQFCYKEDLEAKYQTNKNMIDRFIDNPAYEHLINMSLMDTPCQAEITLIEFKINMIEKELQSREEN